MGQFRETVEFRWTRTMFTKTRQNRNQHRNKTWTMFTQTRQNPGHHHRTWTRFTQTRTMFTQTSRRSHRLSPAVKTWHWMSRKHQSSKVAHGHHRHQVRPRVRYRCQGRSRKGCQGARRECQGARRECQGAQKFGYAKASTSSCPSNGSPVKWTTQTSWATP